MYDNFKLKYTLKVTILNSWTSFASGNGRSYETHFINSNKYFKYIIMYCLQLFCVIQNHGSVRPERGVSWICIWSDYRFWHKPNYLCSYEDLQLNVLPLYVCIFSQSKRSQNKLFLVISVLDNWSKHNSILSGLQFWQISYY